MQRVSLANLKPGMVVAKNIFSSDGRLLIKAGSTVTDKYLPRLGNMGIASVYVINPLFESLDIPEIVNEDIRMQIVNTLLGTFNNFAKTQELEIEQLKPLIKTLVEEIIRNRDTMIHVFDTRTYEDYIHSHSVNVCVLSVLTAISLDYTEAKLRDLAMGVLLHDLGMVGIPKEILMKMGKLSAEEAKIIERHSEIGFEVIRKRRDISVPAAHIAFQHHERFDGGGYPRKLQGDGIHEFARLTSIADIYDALIADRPQRKGMLPHEAFELLMTLAGKYVDGEILGLFAEKIAVYPIGTVLQLSTGEIGIVTKVAPKMQSRPIISLLADRNGRPCKDFVEVNLAEHLTSVVTKIFRENEVFELGKALGA